MATRKKINLALQGGGAHGAFTWGILDRFLEQKIFTIEGISATSAGAMNAVVLAQGMIRGGEEGAREALYNFWHNMSVMGKMCNVLAPTPLDALLSPYMKVPLSFFFFSNMVNMFSPYQLNPLNYHPIEKVLTELIDIEEIKAESKIKLFICATNVKTGKIGIFDNKTLSIPAILASACLPKIFQAVEVEGEYYWDGGYMGNPAIFPLIYNTHTTDIVILHTVPIERESVPTSVIEIDTRLREVSFNSSLMREMRAITFVTKLIEQGWIKDEFVGNLKKLHVHCLRADHELKEFSLASVFSPEWDFLMKLHHLGRSAADRWLETHYDSIGHTGTVNFDEWL